MKRSLVVLSLVLIAANLACAQRRGRSMGDEFKPLAKDAAEKKILDILDEIRANHRTWASVPPADGRMLRLLTEAVGAKHVVEIGTSTGYSGLWFCLALQKTGGKLTTFEYDAGRARMARQHFQQAGVENMVTLVEGDAHQNVPKLKEPVDVVFIDADKDGYVDYLTKLLPLVRPGGLILAHNIDMRGVADDYLGAVKANKDLETVFYLQGSGLSVTMKKR